MDGTRGQVISDLFAGYLCSILIVDCYGYIDGDGLWSKIANGCMGIVMHSLNIYGQIVEILNVEKQKSTFSSFYVKDCVGEITKYFYWPI